MVSTHRREDGPHFYMEDKAKQAPILVVEDNPFNRELLKGVLEGEGYRVDEAKNGKEALEALKSKSYGLIFMDILMPGMDGFETMERIRQMGVKTPIIIASSMSAKEDRQRCLEAGGDDFLPKPVEVGKIKALLEKYKRSGSQEQSVSPRGDSKRGGLDFSQYRLLLIEESEELARRNQRFLSFLGFELTRVGTGDQGWDLLQSQPGRFQIVLSNIFTSGIDGLGLLAKIRRQGINVRVFIYAPHLDPETYQLAIQLGADGLVTEDDFEKQIAGLMESALYQARHRSSESWAADTARQVRKAQKELIKFGCESHCDPIDIAYSPLTDAGGDIAHCRCFEKENACGVILGDVAGHSVMSSYISAIFLGILSSVWNQTPDPMELLKTINHQLNQAGYPEYHLCASALLWDRSQGTLDLAVAGNPGGLLVSRAPDGTPRFEEFAGGGMCLGLLETDDLFLRQTITLLPDSLFFLFSDGIAAEEIIRILSAGNTDPWRPRLHGLSQEILDQILAGRTQTDDMILICLRPSVSGEKRFHRRFPSRYAAINDACCWTREKCQGAFPKGRDPDLILLALREALLNAVIHGNRFDPKSFFELSLRLVPGLLHIQVTDQGSGFDLFPFLNRIEEVDILQSGGRGVPAMYSLADELTVRQGTVSMIFRETRLQGKGDGHEIQNRK